MSNEEEFRNTVTNLLDEQYYPYDESNWNEASRILDKKSKRRRFFFFILAGLGLGFAVGAYFAFAPGDSLNQAEKPLAEAQSAAPLASDKIEDNKLLTEKTNTTGELISGKTKPENNKVIENNPGKVEISITRHLNQTASALPPAQLVKTGSETRLQSGIAPPATSTVTIKSQAPTAIGENGDESNSKASLNPASTLTNTNKAAPAEKESGKTTITESKPANEAMAENPAVPQSETLAASSASVQEQVSTQTPLAVNDSLTKTLVPDTAAKASNQLALSPLPKTNYFYLEAGTYFNMGWKYQGVKEAMGFNPYAGISYITGISRNISLSIGAYYSSVSNLKSDAKTIASAKPGFGLEANETAATPGYPGQGVTLIYGQQNSVTAIKPITLSYVLIPARLHYHIGSNQFVMAAYSLAYLLDVRSKVDTYIESQNTQVNKKSYKTGGYVEGFKTYNSLLSLGYGHRIYKNLWLNGEMSYCLTDVRDNSFFGINIKEQPAGFKISFTYNLIKK